MNRFAALLAVVLLGARGGLAADLAERQFMWNEGNARASSARTPREFATAADAYRRLVASGAENGLLFYNLGTVSLKAGRYDEAAAALLRAERYLGATPDIERNLTLALAAAQRGVPAALPWYRLILFWHYGLPASQRVTVAAVAFSGIWLALALRVAGRARACTSLLAISLIVFMLFGSSALTSLQEEAKARRADSAVVTALRPQP